MNRESTHPISIGWPIAFGAHLAFISMVLLLAYTHKLPHPLLVLPDDLGHFTLMGLLALLAHRAFGRPTLHLPGLALPIAPLLVTTLVAFEEAIQGFSPNRSQEFSDFAADMLGITFFYALDRLALNRKRAP